LLAVVLKPSLIISASVSIVMVFCAIAPLIGGQLAIAEYRS
jgi:hypothetical protein